MPLCSRQPAIGDSHPGGRPLLGTDRKPTPLPRRLCCPSLPDLPCSAGPTPSLLVTTRSSLVKQFSHRLFMRDCTRSSGSHPLTVSRQGRLNLGLFQDLSRGEALHCLQSPQVGKRNDRRRFTTQVDDLVRTRFTRRLCSHDEHRTGNL